MAKLSEQYVLSTAGFSKTVPLKEILPRIAESGFQSVELWADKGHLDPRLDPDVQGVRSLMDSLGLRAHSIHSPYNGLKLGHPRPELLKEWLEVVGRSLEIGVEMGAKLAVVHANSDLGGVTDDDYADSRKLSIAFVNELADRAEELGIRLAVEPLLHPTHLTKCFGTSLEELVEAFPDPRIGFCPDLGHAVLTRDNLLQSIPLAGDRILSIHADSNDGQTDLHLLPSQGVVDWESVKAALLQSGYEGKYVLEISLRIADWDPDCFLQMVSAFVKEDCLKHS